MSEWPDELRRYDPSVASLLARQLASAYWRDRGIDARHIASILRNPADGSDAGDDCLLSRRGLGEELPCDFVPEISFSAPHATFAAILRPVQLPVLRWEDDGSLTFVRADLVHTYYPVQLVAGNPVTAERILADITFVDGFPVLPQGYVFEVGYASPCWDGGVSYTEQMFYYALPSHMYNRDENAVLPLGQWAGRPFLTEDSLPPPGYESVSLGSFCWFTFLPAVGFERPKPAWLRFWAPGGASRPALPSLLPPPGSTLIEVILRAGVRVPDGLPAVPLPQTGGMARVRAVGVDGYGISHNGHHYIRVNTSLEYELSLKRFGVSAAGEMGRTLEVWVDDGTAVVMFTQFNESELSVAGVRIQLPPHERVLFRWRSDEPFPVLAAARLILTTVAPWTP